MSLEGASRKQYTRTTVLVNGEPKITDWDLFTPPPTDEMIVEFYEDDENIDGPAMVQTVIETTIIEVGKPRPLALS